MADGEALDLFGEDRRTLVCGEVETWARDQGYGQLIGLDEAGRGPLAGPVVAAAVCLPTPCHMEGIDDSKRLSPGQRAALFDILRQEATAWSVSIVEHDVIDEVNILQASLLAMERAWAELVATAPSLRGALALVDGNQRVALPADVAQVTLVKGDARSVHVAAASILAKVTRDRIMLAHHATWPEYGFDRHKGYPTRHHLEAVSNLGPSPIHRRSFRMPERRTSGTP